MKRKLAAQQRISGLDDRNDSITTSAKRELQSIEKPLENKITNFIVNCQKPQENLSFCHLCLLMLE